MKERIHSDGEILEILKEHERGMSVYEICQQHGIREDTLFTWLSKFGRSSLSDASRAEALMEENRKLRQVVAEQALRIQELLAADKGQEAKP